MAKRTKSAKVGDKTAKKPARVSPLDEPLAQILVQLFFFDYPDKEFSLNDLLQQLRIPGVGVSKSTLTRAVDALVKTGFLKVQPIGRLWRISCNRQHVFNVSRKLGFSLLSIYESGVIDAIRKRIPNYKAVVLFGSYRNGSNDEKSDLDIAVEVVGDEEYKIVDGGKLLQLGFRQNVQVSLHVFSRNKINLNMFSNIANGIVLDGFLEVRP